MNANPADGARVRILAPAPNRARLLFAVLLLTTALVLVALRDETFVTTDTAQYMGVARNLVDGKGITTSIIYYEEQYLQAGIPAQQTVWPPGFPALIALLVSLGVGAKLAAFVVAFAAHLATPIALALLLRWAGVRSVVSLLFAAAYLLFVLAASYVLACLSEPVFTAVSTLSFAFVLRYVARGGSAWLAAGGVLAALAFIIRYPGVFYIAALGVVFGVRFLIRRDARSFGEGLLLLGAPLLTVVAFFARNLSVTGHLSGGPAPEEPASLVQLVKNLYWSIGKIFGFDAPGAVSLIVLAVLVGATALGVVLLIRTHKQAQSEEAATLCWTIALVYCLITGACLLYLGFTAADYYVSDRYLTPLLPFVIALFAIATERLLRNSHHGGIGVRRQLAACLVVLFAGTLLGQWQVVNAERHWYRIDDRYRTMLRALQAPLNSATVYRHLRDSVTDQHPVLASEGQLLAAMLERPVLGLPEDRYTRRHFDEHEVRRLVAHYGVNYVLFFPRPSGPGSIIEHNQPFMALLAARQAPDWLELVSDGPRLQMYAVRRDVLP